MRLDRRGTCGSLGPVVSRFGNRRNAGIPWEVTAAPRMGLRLCKSPVRYSLEQLVWLFTGEDVPSYALWVAKNRI